MVLEKELGDTNFERLKKALIYVKNNLIDSDNNRYFTGDSFINNIITGSNNITLKKVNVKSNGYDKMYMDTDLIEGKLYQLIDQFNEIKINHKDFSFVLLDNMHPFFNGNGRIYKILFVGNFN